jgi:hypothetical protein
MHQKRRLFPTVLMLLLLAASGANAAKKEHSAHITTGETTGTGHDVLWRDPTDIASRNLFFGPGGEAHQPHTTLTFLKEDSDGTNPKFIVQDQDGVQWSVKLGVEARPETVASRMVWAVGYFTNEDYFLPDLQVLDMPPHLNRGRELVGSNGTLHNVRLKRYLKGEEKIGHWHWRQDPFSGTRELNGLRVMMALINNWDLKDVNNAIYEESDGAGGAPERIYMVSDLGAAFGTTGIRETHAKSKGNFDSYSRSSFISKVTPRYVDFTVPSRPSFVFLFNPWAFCSRLRLRWIGRQVLREDMQWMGGLLARLSAGQIRDAFRAAGYSPQETESFAAVVEARIARLNHL